MKEKDLAAIEKQFGIALSAGYKALLLNYPPYLKALMASEESNTDRVLFDEPRTIIRVNKEVRRAGFKLDEEDEDAVWPAHYFVIGGDIGGNFNCLNLKAKGTPVYFWQHDEGAGGFRRRAKNLKDFIRDIFRECAEVDLSGLEI